MHPDLLFAGRMWLTVPACDGGSGVQILANHPIPAGIECFYYEIEIKKDVGNDTKM